MTPQQRSAFEAHIDGCLECKNYLDSYRKTIRLSKVALSSTDPVPTTVPEDLVKAILALRR